MSESSKDQIFSVHNPDGSKPDLEKIALNEDWADGLIYCDMDDFYLNRHGYLILADECGQYRYCPPDRFVVKISEENNDE